MVVVVVVVVVVVYLLEVAAGHHADQLPQDLPLLLVVAVVGDAGAHLDDLLEPALGPEPPPEPPRVGEVGGERLAVGDVHQLLPEGRHITRT